jgi:hypothetical protein
MSADLATRIFVPVVLAVAMGTALTAQGTPTGPAPVQAGARLAGRVVAGSSTQPVRRAIVQVKGSSLARSRSTITDDEGRFAFDGLPAGRFTITASRRAFITASFGSTAPGRPGTPITLEAGQQISGIEIALTRGAVIAGRVTNTDGEPMPGSAIAVVRAPLVRAAGGLWSPTAAVVTTVETDDRGIYRVFELEAGEYFVAAGVRFVNAEVGMLTSEEIDVGIRDLQQRRAGGFTAPAPAPPRTPSYGFAPVYFPGVVDIASASSVVLAASEERTGVDIVFQLSPAVAIEGLVSGPDGTMPAVVLSLAPEHPSPLPNSLMPRPSLAVPAGPDGRFRYLGVTPGTYVLSARTTPSDRLAAAETPEPGTAGPPPVLWASTTVMVAGTDLSGLALSLRPAMHVSGRIVFDAATGTPPGDLSTVRVTLRALGVEGGYSVGRGALRGRIPVEPGAPAADGTFELHGVLPGTYQIGAPLKSAPGWFLRSGMLDDRDLLDVPLEITADSPDVRGVVLTFSNRHTQLAGVLQTPAGTPAVEYFIVVFTTDRSLWRNQHRRLRSTRPATDGAFSLTDLPPGDYYVAALTDLDPAWQTSAFLEPLVAAGAAVKVTIGEGEAVRQDLQLTR